jgi:hypothetical protein
MDMVENFPGKQVVGNSIKVRRERKTEEREEEGKMDFKGYYGCSKESNHGSRPESSSHVSRAVRKFAYSLIQRSIRNFWDGGAIWPN